MALYRLFLTKGWNNEYWSTQLNAMFSLCLTLKWDFKKNTRCLNRVQTDDLNIMVKTLYVVEDDTCNIPFNQWPENTGFVQVV